MRSTLFLLTLLAASLLSSVRSSADIVVDYTNDSNNFFINNPTARLALEAAVSDLNSVLNLALGEINSDTTVGNSGGGTELTWNFDYRYTNPSTGAVETVADTRLPDNEIRIFVGARNLGGSLLGQGGPTGVRTQISGTIGSGSVADAVSAAQAVHQHRRMDGPVITNISGNVAGAAYSFDLGPTLGNLWFDQDTDNNGAADSTATLEQNWHFDHTAPVAAGKSDFYSVALHEILHSIGIGTAESWDNLVNGTEWLGAEVVALNGGSGAGLIDAGTGHFAEGVMSTRLSDGMAQEVVMDPSITIGTRKELTALDLAMLRDIGYANAAVTAIPEPSALAALAFIFAGASIRRRRR
ncbi:MAG: PEP-CTERM sorting domain-containing protein [Planctomycetota bacterium]